jgi:AsmA protein
MTSLAGPIGQITARASTLDLSALMAFAGGLGRAAAAGPSRAAAPPSASPLNLTVAFDADQASVAGLQLAHLTSRGRLTADRITLDPIAFDLFKGRVTGALTLTPASAGPGVEIQATIARADMGALMAFVGKPGAITGALGGSLTLSGQDLSSSDALQAIHGTATFTVTAGTVKNLGLVRAVVVATSMRAGSNRGLGGARPNEPFSRLGATLAIAKGVARTSDLQFTSPDVLLSAGGTLKLDGSAVDLSGRLQLSQALSKQAGRDLYRYTQQNGRVTLPVSLTGPLDDLQTHVDLSGAVQRAITNKAGEAIRKGLQGLGR